MLSYPSKSEKATYPIYFVKLLFSAIFQLFFASENKYWHTLERLERALLSHHVTFNYEILGSWKALTNPLFS